MQLQPSSSTLKEVTIPTRRSFIVVENDQKVFYPNALGGVASGSAGDVMQQIPMVDIDKDGNITLRGRSPQVLIDGKPSPYSDISTALQMISAAAIERIEVMTNPSAKYDAEGQGGILNIVLKKDKMQGFNGVLNLDIGSYTDNHIGTDFNYRKKHLNLFGNINLHDKKVKGIQTSTQHFLQRDSVTYVNQQSNIDTRHKDIDSRFGVDYFISTKSSLTLTQGLSKRIAENNTYTYLDSGGYFNVVKFAGAGNNTSHSSDVSYNADINFTQHFATPGDLLTVGIVHDDTRITSNTSLDIPQLFFDDQLQQTHGLNNVHSWIVQTDYAGKIGSNGKLEAGYKGAFTNKKNEVNALVYDPADGDYMYSDLLSSSFSYSEHIQAIYATYADSLFGVGYKIGLRSERADVEGRSFLQLTGFKKSFTHFFPSLYLSKELIHNQTLGLSYASRISRPTFQQLLPYVDRTNPVNWQSGNLHLSPAYTTNIEFNYSKLFSKSNDFLNVSIYYSHTNNSIQIVTVNKPGGHTLTTPQNIEAVKAFGSDIIYRFNIKKIVNFTTTLDVNYNKLTGADFNLSSLYGFWNYSLQLEGSITFPANFIFLAHGKLVGPQLMPQGYLNENKGIDVELKRQFFKRKLTLSAIVSDIFYDRKMLYHIATPGFIENDTFRENSRMLHVHISYSF